MARTREERIEHVIGAEGRLTLRAVSGQVTVAGTDGQQATVIARIEGGARLNVRKSNDDLLVEQERPGVLGGMLERDSADFEVRLPRGAFLDVRTVSGDITATDLSGEQNINTVSGDVSLDRLAGRMAVVTVSGDVRVEAATLEVSTATTSGDVQITADRLIRLTARSVSGDIEVKGQLDRGPRHNVETVSGDFSLDADGGGVRVELARAMDLGRQASPIVTGDGAAHVVFRTMSGDLDLRDGRPSAAPSPTSDDAPSPDQRLHTLRALERGEIDVDEAARRLEAMGNA